MKQYNVQKGSISQIDDSIGCLERRLAHCLAFQSYSPVENDPFECCLLVKIDFSRRVYFTPRHSLVTPPTRSSAMARLDKTSQ